jgi:predicted AAA+ superfamily ATPase
LSGSEQARKEAVVMSIEDLRKGKSAEYFIFSELIKRGADVYLPAVDIGIDAIVRRRDWTYLEIQVKSTQEEEQAGYFNVYDLDQHPEENFYIVCVDMNEDNAKVKGRPKIWILPAKEFKEYMVAGCRLPIYERSQKHGNKRRDELIQRYFEAWELLIG